MALKKPSFFSRLTGTGDNYAYVDAQEEDTEEVEHEEPKRIRMSQREDREMNEDEPGELAVDVYQTPDSIVVKALVSGIHPSSIDISLTREMITISGMRQDEREVEDDYYFQRELYWGSFSRTILLPEEVDVDMAEASERHGILMIRLPKINKKREAKIKVRSGK